MQSTFRVAFLSAHFFQQRRMKLCFQSAICLLKARECMLLLMGTCQQANIFMSQDCICYSRKNIVWLVMQIFTQPYGKHLLAINQCYFQSSMYTKSNLCHRVRHSSYNWVPKSYWSFKRSTENLGKVLGTKMDSSLCITTTRLVY